MSLPTLEDLLGAGVRGVRVFVRADLNVPLRDGRVADDTRIRASVPTLERLAEAGARVAVASHLGRPRGERRPDLSLEPVVPVLAGHLGRPVAFAGDCVGPEAEKAVASLREGEVLLLENLRFHPGEEANDGEFARSLARLADAYVNDAFGTAHRAHASTVGIVGFVERVAAGLLLLREVEHLRAVLDPRRPLLCILGGAKVSDKLGVLDSLVERADALAVGGAMAYTFLLALGRGVGSSRVEPERVGDARRILERARALGRDLLLPVDHRIARELTETARVEIAAEIPEGFVGGDIGPRTEALFAERTREAATLFWNGPMGVFELPPFAAGTRAVARAVAESPAHTVVGGGDSVAAVRQMGVADRITHLSTGGGASLEFIEGRTLPALAALER